MSTTTNLHSKEGWTAKLTLRGKTRWVTIDDGEGNDVTFFFKDGNQAARVAYAFNFSGETNARRD